MSSISWAPPSPESGDLEYPRFVLYIEQPQLAQLIIQLRLLFHILLLVWQDNRRDNGKRVSMRG